MERERKKVEDREYCVVNVRLIEERLAREVEVREVGVEFIVFEKVFKF